MARTDNFQKFVKQKKAGTVKEELRQEKKKEKKARAEAIDAHFAKKRAERMQKQQSVGEIVKNGRTNKYPKNKPAGQPGSKDRSSGKISGKAVELTAVNKSKGQPGEQINYTKKDTPIPEGKETEQNRPRVKQAKVISLGKNDSNDERLKPQQSSKNETGLNAGKASGPKKHPTKRAEETTAKRDGSKATADQMPLNKYVAHAGICSRRDAATLVKEGKVTVNGTTASDPGMKIDENDVVKVGNKKVTPSKNFVYILLNKPKDYITTAEDPQGRKTVLDLVRSATDERIYPVGRLDRNTSGVLLLTNDGELAQKLSHPSNQVKKVYEVKLDRPLTKADLDKIATGITLEDGFVAPDVIAYADAKDKSVIGIEIHSGRNRIVRRIFEHFKYDVKGLDRVMFAGLTKKDVQRGRWRFQKDKEIRILKFMNQSFLKVKE